ncbi:MAG: bifunctional adenosylcobinamide kinase/adenosylcobinamide-phosphate guanylyltransferase [Prevotella sp.]|nr:bifunctional adenosylcobinamide kinase/adenosylcobinamide-phosphate guanylyltransferase [Prevotella sp.]
MNKRMTLITGGQRSGKSKYAEDLALSLSNKPTYIATARIWDDEMKERIKLHQARRGSNWHNIEEEKWLSNLHIQGKVAVIDCLTLWCTNFFLDSATTQDDLPKVNNMIEQITKEFDRFIEQDAIFIFVTNEIGLGGISENALQRHFTDIQGKLNQYVASRADEVILMVSGIPLKIK